MNDLAKCTTDEELVNVIENKFSIVNHLGEFDVNIEDLKTSLGIPLEQSDIDRINHLKYPGMYFATMLNKFSVIASPYYPKYKDMPSISQLSFELADMLDNLPPKCARLFNATFDFPGYKREMGHYFSTFTQLGANVNFIKGEFQRKVFDNIMMIRLQKFEAPTFKTLNGIDLPLAEATSELQHKRYVDVYSSHKFVARIKLTSDEFISEFGKPFKMDLKKGDATILQTRLQELKEALDSCNPKHVRFEAAIHIGNSGKYQKVVDELAKLLKTDLSKPIEVEKSLKKISEGINDYLVEKTRDGKTKVELTNKREDVMLKAYNFFKPLADQNAVLLEAQVSTTEQLDFLDKVQTTILTDEPENTEDTVPFDDAKSTDAVLEKDI